MVIESSAHLQPVASAVEQPPVRHALLTAPWKGWFMLVVAALLGGWLIYHLGLQARASGDTSAALSAMKRWPQGRAATTADWTVAEQALQRALSVSGGNADIHEALASVYMSWPSDRSFDPVEWVSRLQVARQHLERSVAMRPMVPGAWSKLALVWDGLRRLGAVSPDDPRLWEAFDRAVMTGFRVASVQMRLMDLALSRWGEMSEDRRAVVRDMVVQATPAQQKRLREQARRRGVSLE